MEILIPRGKYIAAVSGGVDSMVLLDLLAKLPDLELVVAHFDHGIRPDSHNDEQLVREHAKRLKLAYEAGYGRLGPKASEESAREARYGFLDEVMAKHAADKIITAHHQDDMIETALINTLRGTGRRGLSSISRNQKVLRPMLGFSKNEIMDYAKKNHLVWREDVTNTDTDYLRNYLRINALTELDDKSRLEFAKLLNETSANNDEIDYEIATLSQQLYKNGKIDRRLFAELPAALGDEMVVYWLKANRAADFDRKTVARISLAIKTAKPGSSHPVKNHLWLRLDKNTAEFEITPKKRKRVLV